MCSKCGFIANLVPIHLCEAKRGRHALCHECAIPSLFREPLASASTLEAAIEAICSALALQPQDEDTLLLYQNANVFQARARTPHPRVPTLGEHTVLAPTVPEPEPDADHRVGIKCSTPTSADLDATDSPPPATAPPSTPYVPIPPPPSPAIIAGTSTAVDTVFTVSHRGMG